MVMVFAVDTEMDHILFFGTVSKWLLVEHFKLSLRTPLIVRREVFVRIPCPPHWVQWSPRRRILIIHLSLILPESILLVPVT